MHLDQSAAEKHVWQREGRARVVQGDRDGRGRRPRPSRMRAEVGKSLPDRPNDGALLRVLPLLRWGIKMSGGSGHPRTALEGAPSWGRGQAERRPPLGVLGVREPPTPARSVPQTCRRGTIKWERRSDVVGRSIRRRSAYPRTCVACRQTARIELEGAVLGALDRHPAPHPTMAVIVVGLATGASGAGRTRCVRRRARRSSPRAGVGRRAGRVRRGSAVARRAAGRGRSRVC